MTDTPKEGRVSPAGGLVPPSCPAVLSRCSPVGRRRKPLGRRGSSGGANVGRPHPIAYSRIDVSHFPGSRAAGVGP